MSDKRLTAEPGTLDKTTAKEALAWLARELGPEWNDTREYVDLLFETYTMRLHQILLETAMLDLSEDGRLIVEALLDYADRHRSATLRGIAQSVLDNLIVDKERLRGG